MLEVTIISANLITKSRGPFYVKLWIVDHQNSMLETKKVSSYSTGSGSKPIWNQKFVFAIPHTFVVDNKVSSVGFEVFRVRKGFPDKSLGKAEGKLQLEKTSNEEKTNNEVIYDSEMENEYFCTDEESDNGEEEKEEGEEVDSCELKGTGRVGVGGGGELNVEMAVQKGFLSRVGQCKWRGWAMEYDEFMGTTCIKEKEKKKKKKEKSYLLMCFGKTTTKD
ncbi:hypothetical protein RHSIM_Rhsim07G0008800 [Rhododendron simsii]|uniref:C2 domain-containing protein n=1 Tax=Rhododendron simsii TaxID=118357 RepID=A0A834GS62_RHOSS|nr:hypothetical protein RHSIM_Rhsim07G0008800 [Rhododendron simsii]